MTGCFRILLNETTTIHLPVIDNDNDLIKCKWSAGVSLEDLPSSPTSITVNEVSVRL